MKHLYANGLRILTLLATVASMSLLATPKAIAAEGATYVATVKDPNGDFNSRAVIVLHADHTLSVRNSGPGWGGILFTNQLGSWIADGSGGVIGRAIDFNFPQPLERLDYKISFENHGNTISGSFGLFTYPLDKGPRGPSTYYGVFTFEGDLLQP